MPGLADWEVDSGRRERDAAVPFVLPFDRCEATPSWKQSYHGDTTLDMLMRRRDPFVPRTSAEEQSFARLSNTDRFVYVVKEAAKGLPGTMGEKLLELVSPTNIAYMSAGLAVIAAMHVFLVGWVVDAAVIGLTAYALGEVGEKGLQELKAAVEKTLSARNYDDLHMAARHLREAVLGLGVALATAILLKKAVVYRRPVTREVLKRPSLRQAPQAHGARTGAASDAAAVSKKPPPDNFATYVTHGIKDSPLRSPEGRRLVKQYVKQGYAEEEAVAQAQALMETGSTLPHANPVEIGDRFYKVVPRGGMPGPKSEFWATKEQIEALKGTSFDNVAGKFGLPLESQQAAYFDVVEVQAVRPTTVFVSEIAPTTQNGWSQAGGAVQSLITDRSAFSAPIQTGMKLP